MEWLRNASKGWAFKIFLGLLVVSFAVWGIADVFRGFSSSALATVGATKVGPLTFGGVSVSSEEYSRTFNRELQTFSKQLGQSLTMEQARAMGYDRVILDRLVHGAALTEQARELGLEISSDTIAEETKANPVFKDAQGAFSQVRFRNYLDNIGLNESGYVATEKVQRLRAAITEAVADDAAPPAVLVEAAHKHQNEQRDAKYFVAKVAESELPPPGEAEIEKFYKDFPAAFTAPEYRSIAILKAEAADVMARLPVSEEEAKAAYEANKADYFQEETRTVQQIVFPSKEDAQKAKDRIAKGEDFNAIAKEMKFEEKDTLLGTLRKGDLIDETIAEAAFKLADGTVSDPVQGKLSVVLLKVKVVQAEHQQTFEEAKAAVTQRVQQEKAIEELRSIFDAVEDARAQQTPFEEIGAKANLPFVKVDAVDAAGLGKDGQAVDIPHKDEILKVAFETDPGVETDAISTKDGGFVWFAVREVAPAAVRPFDQVKDQARTSLIAARLREFAIEKGKKLAERGKTGAKLEDLAKEAGAEVKTVQGLKRNESSGDFDSTAVTALFSVPEGGFASAVEGDGLSVRVMQSQAVLLQAYDPASAEAKALAKTLGGDAGEDLIGQYLRSMEQHVGVSIDEGLWRQITGVPAN